jgi:predicted 3-demethylubiquinone-9 3-methyltransferase (glyoxalase superfamily)
MLSDPDPEKSKKVMEAMLKMKKIDIGRLKQASDQR